MAEYRVTVPVKARVGHLYGTLADSEPGLILSATGRSVA